MPKLEIYSDFICVWCYFAKRDIKRLEEEYAIKIVWRAFPLNPDIKDDGVLIEKLFADNLTLMTDKCA